MKTHGEEKAQSAKSAWMCTRLSHLPLIYCPSIKYIITLAIAVEIIFGQKSMQSVKIIVN